MDKLSFPRPFQIQTDYTAIKLIHFLFGIEQLVAKSFDRFLLCCRIAHRFAHHTPLRASTGASLHTKDELLLRCVLLLCRLLGVFVVLNTVTPCPR